MKELITLALYVGYILNGFLIVRATVDGWVFGVVMGFCGLVGIMHLERRTE